MSIYNTMAALEEFTEEVNSEIAPDQPEDGAFDETTAGVDYQEESDGIDGDVDSIVESAQGLEDIISLLNDAPGESDAPMEPFVEKAVNVALESNDVVTSSGNPLATTADKGKTITKDGALDKIKAFAAKVWDMLRNFGKRIYAWIQETWAKYTDRIVKNANTAKKILEQESSLATKSGAAITDKGLLAKLATAENTDIGDVVLNVFEHAEAQGGKESEKLLKEARTCIDLVAGGAVSGADAVMERFTKALEEAAGTYDKKATAAQAQAVPGNAAGTETYLGKPFFGGFRPWTTIPVNAEALSHYNHGITKIDEVKAKESIPAPDAQEIKGIAEYIVDMSKLVAIYQSNLKSLDALNKELDKAASKAKNAKSESKTLKAMQAVVPRLIKGPQVAAYAYAASASTVALQYCQAAINAHQGTEEKKPEAPASKEVATA